VGVPVDSTERPRLLVVDDNAALAENLGEILDAAGYHTRSADSCAEARGVLNTPLDVALIDLHLPDGDGRSLTLDIKSAHPDAEVILLTGHATIESAAESVRAGAFAYLLKPCATPELLLTVEQALRQVRLRQEKAELARRAQLSEKLAAVGTLTAGLSHEIRNPLNAAGLQLNVLERRIRNLPQEMQTALLEPATLVRDEIRRLDHILEDFLQFARPTRVVPKPVPLGALLERVLALEGGDATQRGIRLRTSGADGVVVLGDEGRLQQVLVNLVLNALDATPREGEVRIICRLFDADVVLTVEDTGPGVPADALPHVFEPFYTTKASGSGLGLPIVHAIVTQHGGTISIENIAGAGARVTLRLPAAR
jgi:two-component system, NtrC family, sensor histidine kinase HydH